MTETDDPYMYGQCKFCKNIFAVECGGSGELFVSSPEPSYWCPICRQFNDGGFESYLKKNEQFLDEIRETQIDQTYYAVRSRKTGKFYSRLGNDWTGNLDKSCGCCWKRISVTDCLEDTEDQARELSELATDDLCLPEPVEIVKIKIICEVQK